MPYLYNLRRNTQLRKTLRNNATPSERLLWHYLKKSQLLGLKFRRQYGIRNFVVDFYCPEIRLAIEIDGDSHFASPEAVRNDEVRQHRLAAFDIHFLRLYSSDVLHNTEEVMDVIVERARELKFMLPI